MTDRSHDIDVLNGLIALTLDSSRGYREAAEQSKNVMIVDLFQRWSSERHRVVEGLREMVRELGGRPEDDGTVLASVHRIFLDLRAHIGASDKGVEEEVERGEDYIKHKFEKSLKDKKIGTQARTAIQTAYVSVSTGHDEMRDLKHSYSQD